MSAKHTPGPWRAISADSTAFRQEWTCHEDTETHSCWQPIVNADCNAVALVVDAGSGRDDRVSFEADARLIAAAPDLLEALRGLIDMDVAYRRGPVVEQAVEKALAAIAKATGSAS